MWPFWLWPFWFVAVLDFQCGRFGLTLAVLAVAVLVCGRFGRNSLLVVQVGVGERVNADQLRAIVSANESYTTLIESNFTLLVSSLTEKLTDILCNSQHSYVTLPSFRIPREQFTSARLGSPEMTRVQSIARSVRDS